MCGPLRPAEPFGADAIACEQAVAAPRAARFLIMIGMTLIADGMGYHVPKGYIYAAMGFSAFVEGLNMLHRKRRAPKPKPAPAAAKRTATTGAI